MDARVQHPLHILLVEQDADIRDLFATLFANLGHRVSMAAEAGPALDLARRDTPDAVFSSLVFADMDGFALCRRLRALPGTAHSLIVALTGYCDSGIEERVRAAGFNHYLLKPATLHTLLGLLEPLIRGEQRATMSAQRRLLADRREHAR